MVAKMGGYPTTAVTDIRIVVVHKVDLLHSDGYGAYEAYAKKTCIIHAQCWTHCRREFISVEKAEWPLDSDNPLTSSPTKPTPKTES